MPGRKASTVGKARDAGRRPKYRILGPLEAWYHGRALELGTHRQRALLAALLLRANDVVSRDQLIEELWGEAAPASAPNMVQVYVSRLRKSLGTDVLLTQAPGYLIRIENDQLDAAQFAALVAKAEVAMAEGETDVGRELLGEALELWRGPALADFMYEAFAQGEAARLEESRLEAIELRIDADLTLGRQAGLVGELERLIALHPFRERLRGQLMVALYRAGRQAEALDAYRAARTTMVEELGIEPGFELQRLEREILTQDPGLGESSRARTPGESVRELARVGNLPPELTSLIGREADVKRLVELTAAYRLVTLIGVGGVGKTRLAQRVAGTIANDFEHGVWFADLAALERSGDVGSAVASVLGVPDRPGSVALDTVVSTLRERSLLLVLDNCEHVLGSAAEVATQLIHQCHSVRILATSRTPMAIAGERVARLDPLATTPSGSEPASATTLFLDRAQSQGASLETTPDALEVVGELCMKLDGIPLAIELAAARSRAISPAELLARLDDRLQLLARPRGWSAHQRQRTLEAAIGWSYDLLSGEEQATLRRLSVFHGGFSLAAAAAVCADIGEELDTLERVAALVDRSTVSIERRDGSDRYRLLESIGLFALRRLRDEGEVDRARGRHARFFRDFASAAGDRARGGDPTTRPARLDAEQDNLAAALSWCLDGGGNPSVGGELAAEVGFHWICRGRSNTAEHWLERALERGHDVPPAILVRVHLAYGVLAFSAGELDAAAAHDAEAVAISREINDAERLAEALAQLALDHQARGLHADAAGVAQELRTLQPRLSSPRAQAMALLGTAQVALASGRPDRARADTSRAREIASRARDYLCAALSGFWLAYALALDSAISTARAVIEDAMEDAVAWGYQLHVADNLSAQISLALADGDLETARRLLPSAIEMLRRQQRSEDVGHCLQLAALVELKQGFPERSAALLGAGLRWQQGMSFQDRLLLPDLAELPSRLRVVLGDATFTSNSERGHETSLARVTELLSTHEQAS